MTAERWIAPAVIFAVGCSMSPEECSDDAAWLAVEISAVERASETPLTIIRVNGWQHTGEWSRDEHGSIQGCARRELQHAKATLDSASGTETLVWRDKEYTGGVLYGGYEGMPSRYDGTYTIELEEDGE